MSPGRPGGGEMGGPVPEGVDRETQVTEEVREHLGNRLGEIYCITDHRKFVDIELCFFEKEFDDL